MRLALMQSEAADYLRILRFTSTHLPFRGKLVHTAESSFP